MPNLEFTQVVRYPDKPEGITLPALLRYQGKSIAINAKVDTGATYCLFRYEHGVELGIPVEQGVPLVMDSLGGPFEAYGHDLVIQTCGFAFESFVYFAKHPGLRRNLLGRIGWLRNLRLAIVDYENLLFLNRVDHD